MIPPKTPKADWMCRFLQSLLHKFASDPTLQLCQRDRERIQECTLSNDRRVIKYVEELKVCLLWCVYVFRQEYLEHDVLCYRKRLNPASNF